MSCRLCEITMHIGPCPHNSKIRYVTASGRQFGRTVETLRKLIIEFGPKFEIEVYPSKLIKELSEENAALREALEFYGAPLNWNFGAIDGIAESFIMRSDLEDAGKDLPSRYSTAVRCFNGGKRAREVLARYKRESET